MADPNEPQSGLAWPDHDSGPTPPPEYQSREREDERRTRKKMPLWDRIKFLLLLGVIAFFLLSAEITSNPPLQSQFMQNPLVGIGDALRVNLGTYAGLGVLAALEVLRQLHYLVCEHWSRYYLFWSKRVAGWMERRRGKMDDWTRFRISRVVRIVFLLLVANFVLAAVFDLPVATALLEAPGALLGVLPLALRLVFGFFFVIVQFVGLFWFLSRGGVDTYFPDDIKTRFTDVWGQDNVLEKIKENMVFLEDPEKIEARGGYVPGGILLWGPPGTGKTLMAEAVAGETGRPFMFIDPGAFAQPLTGRVLTPTGWSKMGELQVGDLVVGRDGQMHTVLGVYPQGVKDIYRVRFSDGAETRVTADHLWAVQTPRLRKRGKDRLQIRQTRKLGRLKGRGRHGWRYSVPLVAPVNFLGAPQALHPYALGALLGGGCFTGRSVMLINPDPIVVERVRSLLPDRVDLAGSGPRYRLCGKGEARRSVVRELLADLGLDCPLADEKFIPEPYLYGPTDERLELLRGLMDTNGCVRRAASGKRFVTFGTGSARLREDFTELVQSFGGLITWSEHRAPADRVSRRRPFWDGHVHMPAGLSPFHTKAERMMRHDHALRRYIAAIEPDGSEEAQCILVDAPDHLYVTDDFIVTHNTNMFMGVGILKVKSLFRKARKLALRYGGVILFFDEADSLGSRGALAQGPPGGFRMEQPQAAIHAAAPACNGLSYIDPATASMLWRAGLADASSGDQPRPRLQDRIIMGGMGGGGMGTLNALLTELSGLKKPRGFFNRVVRRTFGLRPKPPPKYRIMVMMATNLPQALDEALLRPGRIDRIYKVGYPSKIGRIRTYKGYLDKVRNDLSDEEVDKLATITPYATGATIKDLVNEALINAIRDGREVITWRDVVKAKQLKDLGPPEDVEYIERERHAVAVHEACHAVTAHRVRQHLTIDIATIEKGGTYLGMVASIPPEDQFTRWRSEYEADIMVSIASLAGERMFFDGDNSSGVSGDLESATRVATMMEGFWGMGSTVASHGVTRQAGIPGGGGKPGEDDRESELLRGDLGGRIENKLTELLARAEELLAQNRLQVLAVAHALESHKTVTGDDVRAIIEGVRGPLIDGRPYHTDAFLDAAEAYHREMGDAHRRHAKVQAPLPGLPRLESSSTGNGEAPDPKPGVITVHEPQTNGRADDPAPAAGSVAEGPAAPEGDGEPED